MQWPQQHCPCMMRLGRRLPSALLRRLRAPRPRSSAAARCPVISSLQVTNRSISLSTPALGSPLRLRHIQTRQFSIPVESIALTDAFPALKMLQTLEQWERIPPPEHHEPEDPARHSTVGEMNFKLRRTLFRGQYGVALTNFSKIFTSSDPKTISTATYGTLLVQWNRYCAGSTGKRVEMDTMLALLEQLIAIDRIDVNTFRTAIFACQNIGALRYATRVIELMKQSGHQPGEFEYSSLLSCCARLAYKHKKRQAMFVQDAEAVFQEYQASRTPTAPVVNAMLAVYRSSKGYSPQAVALVDRAISEWKMTPDAFTVNTLLASLVKDGNSLEAARWLERAVRRKWPVDAELTRAVVDISRRDGQWQKVDRLKEVLQRYGFAQHDRHLQRVLHQIRHRDASWDKALVPFATDVSTKKLKQQARAEQRRLLENHTVLHDHAPVSMETWTVIFKHGDLDMMDELVDLLLERKESPVFAIAKGEMDQVLAMYFRALGNANRWRQVLGVVERTLTLLDVKAFAAAVRACGQSGRLEEALLLVELMVERRRMRPDKQVYEGLLLCCSKTGDVTRVLAVFGEMERRGLSVTQQDVTAVLKTFAVAVQHVLKAEAGQVEVSDVTQLAVHALNFYHRVVGRTSGVDGSKRVVGEQAVLHLLRSMLGHAETVDVLDILVGDSLMDDENDSASGDLYKPGMVVNLPRAVQQICRDAAAQGILSVRVVNVGIDYCLRRGKPESAFELFNTMAEAGISPSADTIRLLFDVSGYTGGDPQLGLMLLEHLIAEEERDENILNVAARKAVATNALRWAAEMELHGEETTKTAGLFDRVMQTLKRRRGGRGADADYESVVAVFAFEGDIVKAKLMAERAEQEQGKLGLDVANRVVQACSIARAPEAALRTVVWMQQRGVAPDLLTYNNVLGAILRRMLSTPDQDDDDDEDEDEVVEEDEKEEEAYAAEEAKSSRRSSPFEMHLSSTVDELLMEMKECGVAPDSRTFELAICIASERQELWRVAMLFDQLVSFAAERHVPMRDVLSDRSLQLYLDACSALAESDAVAISARVEAVRQMLQNWRQDRNARVPSSIVVKLLEVHDALGQWKEAVNLVKQMEVEFGVAPKPAVVKTVMASCNRAGQYRVAEQIYTTLERSVRHSADCVVEMVLALEQQDKWVDATQLFTEATKQFNADELRAAQVNRIALGRYAEGRVF